MNVNMIDKKVASFTLGCKVNQYDTEAVIETFKNKGYKIVNFEEVADIYIVNTCTVTGLSDKKCRQMLRRTKKINPNSTLVAMGCYVQSMQDKLKKEIDEIDIIVGTNNRLNIINLVEQFDQHRDFEFNIEDIMEVTAFEELKINTMNEHTRVYLKIQEGCNNYCSYCIIPYVRGKIRSRHQDNILEETKRLVARGFKEIVLTGIHLASYGKDLSNISLNTLLFELNNIEGLKRIRLGSIEPIIITDEFISTLKNSPKVCDHFHLSLQSGSNSVLKRMHRKYTTKEYLECVNKLREIYPNVAITTDIIVGFPGETEQEFIETLNFVKEVGFAKIHVFPFSAREGTLAFKMTDQIAPNIKNERVNILSNLEKTLRIQYLKSFINKDLDVLIEKLHDNENNYVGYTTNYIKVQIRSSNDLVEGNIYNVNITNIDEDILL
ncbi:tRNA (N(6)-L-threonylcarbamoyladenosine(37)-C(2))-methylthiotransferase MtaB, partial [Candidatus Epulonipiscium fishelsonii]